MSEIESDFRTGNINLDQKILYQLYAGFQPGKLPANYRPHEDLAIKCGFPSLIEYHRNRGELNTATIASVESITQKNTQAEHMYQSPGGKFVIHYDTSGENAVPAADNDPAFGGNGVPDYVDWIAAAADSSWRHQVMTLGYDDPVTGPADPYPIYIESLSFYGYTDYGSSHEPPINVPTYIAINSHLDDSQFHDNDDENKTYGAIKVTVAHELKHAIQFTNSEWYGYTGQGAYPANVRSPHATSWSETDATLMEEVVYDNVNDYYGYIETSNSIFLSSDHEVPASYYGITWSLYFHEKYGENFWTSVWDRIRVRFNQEQENSNPDFLTMVEAVSATLQEDYNDRFDVEFSGNQLWHYASGSNSREKYGFEEKLSYPDPQINLTLTARDSIMQDQTITPMSAEYIDVFKGPNLDGYVQVFAEYQNPATNIALIGLFNDGSVETIIRPGNESGEFNIEAPWEWSAIDKVGIVVANSSETVNTDYRLIVTTNIPEEIRLVQNYPNPFNPGTTIEFTLPEESRVELNVYDITGRLVATLRDGIHPAGYHDVEFNGSNLASGVYIYRMVTDSRVISRKMTLIK